MVSEQVRMFEEEQRTATAVTQGKQYAWTKGNDIEPIKLSLKSLITIGTTGDIILSALYI